MIFIADFAGENGGITVSWEYNSDAWVQSVENHEQSADSKVSMDGNGMSTLSILVYLSMGPCPCFISGIIVGQRRSF